MGAWMQPLCFFAAEAAAQRDWALAARALDAASACIQHGSSLQVPHQHTARRRCPSAYPSPCFHVAACMPEAHIRRQLSWQCVPHQMS